MGIFTYTHEQYNYERLLPEAMYVDILQSFEKMQAMGLAQLRDYQPDQVFYFYCNFMMGLEDYEEAYRLLVVAEHVIQPDGKNFKACTLYLNYLQDYWTRKKNHAKAIEYAEKIIQLYENLQTDDPEFAWRSRFWRGFSKLSIADLMDAAGKTEGVERFADEGYRLIKLESPGNHCNIWIAEYDALRSISPSR
ncbi:MAG: hypothetical protein IPM82_20435 [Saprospiraceae bacterium]|nr:hypothetical protein [Saprospiraceae bacterium]